MLWHFYHSYKWLVCGSIIICVTFKLFAGLSHFHITNPRFVYFSKYSNELFRVYRQCDLCHNQGPFKWVKLIKATFLIIIFKCFCLPRSTVKSDWILGCALFNSLLYSKLPYLKICNVSIPLPKSLVLDFSNLRNSHILSYFPWTP